MTVVRKQLSAPIKCDNCGSDRIGLTSNSVVYGVQRGDWPYCFYCDECSAMVGCHPNTHLPMGLMATGPTRRKRKQLHVLFDPIWRLGYISRDDAYIWLAKELEIESDNCHIGELTLSKLQRALEIMRAHSSNGYSLFIRRKEKNELRKSARLDREDNRITRRKFVKNKY